jgi:hypothetical protein
VLFPLYYISEGVLYPGYILIMPNPRDKTSEFYNAPNKRKRKDYLSKRKGFNIRAYSPPSFHFPGYTLQSRSPLAPERIY